MRYQELDSLRGLAALSVFFSHAIGACTINYNLYNSINYSIFHIFWDGNAAVMLFFVLSGYVLSLPYLGNDKNQIKVFPFIIKRIFRIYPAYLFSLVLCITLKKFCFEKENLLTLSTWINQLWTWNSNDLSLSEFSKHILMIGPSFNTHLINSVIWSLIIEMKISLIFPFILYFLQKKDKIISYLSIITISIILFYLLKINFLGSLPLFITGSIIARYQHFFKRISYLNWRLKILLIIIGLFLYTSKFSLSFIRIQNDYLIVIGAAIIVLCSLFISRISAILQKSLFTFLGKISYSFYLVHLGVLITTISIVMGYINSMLISTMSSLILSLAISAIFYYLVEKPFITLGRWAILKIDTFKVSSIKS
jgi:Predicted acyltransferases